ncbi:MAG: DUF1573 domain-containing protein [Bacteroidota bacterium]
MTKFFFLSIISFVLLSDDITIEWTDSTEHDFETIAQGIPKTHKFTFKNTHDEPIVIETIRTTCGCTVPEWSEEPVLPDSLGTIQLQYDAQKMGYFRKKIRVFFAHQRKAEHLFIEGFVE